MTNDATHDTNEQTTQDAKSRNRQQFGANASNYATSDVHAKGASLARMVELADPQNTWDALDIATAAGRTAFAFAPHVSSVVATDLTPEMVELAEHRAVELGHHNVTVQLADAEALPFDDASFDLVTCRIAPHHFPHPQRFIAEVARVLRDDGHFVMVDNVVPDEVDVAKFCNDWERRRDPSHVRCLSMSEWSRLCTDAGLAISHQETADKRMIFQTWADNMSVEESERPALLDDLLTASAGIRAWLRPQGTTQANAAFSLTEGLLVARHI